jgi:hypothetical protein
MSLSHKPEDWLALIQREGVNDADLADMVCDELRAGTTEDDAYAILALITAIRLDQVGRS